MDELAKKRIEQEVAIRMEIEKRRAARMEKQFDMIANKRKIDQAILGGTEISEEEEEVYTVSVDEDGEIEVEKEEEK